MLQAWSTNARAERVAGFWRNLLVPKVGGPLFFKRFFVQWKVSAETEGITILECEGGLVRLHAYAHWVISFEVDELVRYE